MTEGVTTVWKMRAMSHYSSNVKVKSQGRKAADSGWQVGMRLVLVALSEFEWLPRKSHEIFGTLPEEERELECLYLQKFCRMETQGHRPYL